MNETVTLREISRDNIRDVTALKVKPDQLHLVASAERSLAFAPYIEGSWCRCIYAGETPVGFVMLREVPEERRLDIWRFLIDGEHQGRGHGAEALGLVLELGRSRPAVEAMLLSHAPAEPNAGPFYEKYGFRYTGETDADGELFMRFEF
ncbi:MAG: GNAT family N-acetyltransferase [Planctomycetota bacterium]|jgi:diamine N-acetyltransferase